MVDPVSGGMAARGAARQTSAAQDGAGGQQMFAKGDFQTFLRMLTAQLKNQDPMNPMEGSDFAVQLATFSGVEQQAQTNKLLTEMTQAMGGGLGELSVWIGREVRVAGPVWFGAKPVKLSPQGVIAFMSGQGRAQAASSSSTGSSWTSPSTTMPSGHSCGSTPRRTLSGWSRRGMPATS